jgi:uncharacterized repeat protein (TIGR01451 family)
MSHRALVPTLVPGPVLSWDFGDYFVTNDTATILLDVRKRCSTDTLLAATVSWNGLCSRGLVPRSCLATATDDARYLDATLGIVLTPEIVYATASTVAMKTYVYNTGSGAAYDVWVDLDLADDLELVSYTLSWLGGSVLGPGDYQFSSGNSHTGAPLEPGATWLVASIPAGETVVLTIEAEIVGCTDLSGTTATAGWGCCGDSCQAPVSDQSSVVLLPTGVVVSYDLPNTIGVCYTDTVEVIVKNTNVTAVYDVELSVTLPTGLSYYPSPSPPPQDDTATPLVWTSAEIPALATLSPGATVVVSFDVYAECQYNGSGRVSSTVDYTKICGLPDSASATSAAIGRSRPSITIAKTGRNITQGVTSYGETIDAVPGDLVEWRIVLTNTTSLGAPYVAFWDDLPASMDFVSISPLPAIGSGTTGDPWVHGALLGGGSATYVVTARVRDSGGSCTTSAVVNRAYVAYGCSAGCIILIRNNTASLRTSPVFTVTESVLGTATTCDATLRIVASKVGPPAYGSELVATIPDGYAYASMVSGPAPSSWDASSITWDLGTVFEVWGNASQTLEVALIADGSRCSVTTPVTATAMMHFENACGTALSRTGNTVTIVPQRADFSVSLTPSVQTVSSPARLLGGPCRSPTQGPSLPRVSS